MSCAYADSFWGGDLGSTAGYDALAKRLTDGKLLTKNVAEYIKRRAKIEESYGKELSNLAKMLGGKDEIGTLKAAIESLRQETDEMGQAHIRMAAQLLTEFEKPLMEFKTRQKLDRKAAEDPLKKSQKSKLSAYEKMVKAKKNYDSKCKEADAAEEAANRGGGKDPAKARQKADKARQSAHSADTQYQEAVRQLEEIRVGWEEEFVMCATRFQEIDVERINFTRDTVWNTLNVFVSQTQFDEQSYEKIRKSLEACSPEADVETVAQTVGTGRDRPAPAQYVNFYSGASTSFDAGRRTSSFSSNGGGTIRRGTGSFTTPSSGTLRGAPAPPPPVQEEEFSRADGECVRAPYDYDAQGDEELSFRAGDVITIVNKEDDLWWLGELNGRQGMLPTNFVEMC
eukprot:Opistho-1_new@109225